MRDLKFDISAINRTGRAFGQVQAALGGIEGRLRTATRAAGAFALAMGTTFAAFGIGGLVRGVIRTNREFQSLQATLETFTGSTEKAAGVFAVLRDFAARTPFSLAELTKSFNRMLAVGISPTIRALEAFGNVASGSGKRVIDFVEAVADAAVGEFERLKEFGIKARVEGDKVAFTFKGVKTSVEREAGAISEFLTKLGETEFAGAIARQAATINGALSNLGDAFDGFAAKVGEGGFNDAFAGFVRRLTDMVAHSDGLAKVLSGALTAAVSGLEAAFFGLARAVQFGRDNLALLSNLLLGLVAVRLAPLVATWAVAFVKFASAVRLAGLAMAAFAGIQRIARTGLVIIAGLVAHATGAFDALKAKLADLSASLGGVSGELMARFAAALEGLGVNTSALTDDLSTFIGATDAGAASTAELDARLRALGVGADSAADKLATASGGAKSFQERLQDLAAAVNDHAGHMANALGSAFRSIEDVFVNFVRTGKFEFKSLVDSILGDVARLAVQRAITGPLSQLLAGSVGAGQPAPGGGLGSIFSSLFGGFFADGGRLGAGKVGIAGERGPELITGPAMVTPLPARTVVNIINHTGEPVRQETRRRGGETLETFVIGAVNRGASRGDLDAGFGSFGARRLVREF